jgi:hypothetical protein
MQDLKVFKFRGSSMYWNEENYSSPMSCNLWSEHTWEEAKKKIHEGNIHNGETVVKKTGVFLYSRNYWGDNTQISGYVIAENREKALMMLGAFEYTYNCKAGEKPAYMN